MDTLGSTIDTLRPGASSPIGKSTGFVVVDMLLVLGVVLVLCGLLFVWARYIRKPRKDRREYPPPPSADSAATDSNPESSSDASPSHHHHRHRRRRKAHRKRNPTLAQIGGLPPVRDVNPTDSP